jgi:ferritin-like metal-binding protein YciE
MFLPMPETTREYLTEHLENVIAAERNFEDVLSRFSSEGEQEDVKNMFSSLSAKARTQHQRLEGRLRELGGSPSTLKSAVAHLLAAAPLIAQTGQTPQEKNTQHLIITYAAAAAEMAMYEALATVAGASGDSATEQLARQLQREEKEDHAIVWSMLASSAQRSFNQARQPD